MKLQLRVKLLLFLHGSSKLKFSKKNHKPRSLQVSKMRAGSWLLVVFIPSGTRSSDSVDIIDYTNILVQDVFNGSYYSNKNKDNPGKTTLSYESIIIFSIMKKFNPRGNNVSITSFPSNLYSANLLHG
jgi:hypothetical protein